MDLSYITIQIGQHSFQLNDLGTQMNTGFENIYLANLHSTSTGHLIISSRLGFSQDFLHRSFDFFDINGDDHETIDKYFNNFSIIYKHFLDKKLYAAAQQLWMDVLDFAYQWEISRKGQSAPLFRIHKGTPFYWMGGAAVLAGDLSKGFPLIHQALNEDIRTSGPNSRTPAFFFVTLDYMQIAQYFYPILLNISNFLNAKLHTYRSSRGGTLLLDDFKSRFLENIIDFRDVIFHFVYVLFQTKRLEIDVDRSWRTNIFGSLLETTILFDICLVIESLLKDKDTTNYRQGQVPYFSNRIYFLSRACSLSLRSHRLKQIKKDALVDFRNPVENLMNSTYRRGSGPSLLPIEEDIAISYILRNFRAHTLQGQQIICENFESLIQRVFNMLFFVIEKLY